MATTSAHIADRILEAVMARRLAPGARLGEQQLAALFDCSRTLVREALMRLAARGLVTVSARRGWFLAKPTADEAREAFEARHVIETGLLRRLKAIDATALRRLRDHVRRQQSAVAGHDAALRTYLLGDFHVCLAESLGNKLLAATLREYTARTALVAMHWQTPQDAARSCAEHAAIVDALEAGDLREAEKRLARHLHTWDEKLHLPGAGHDPLHQLRHALAPVNGHSAQVLHTTVPSVRRSPRRPPAAHPPAARPPGERP